MSEFLGPLLIRLVAGGSLNQAEAFTAMDAIMKGEISPPSIAAFLTALRAKGETPQELAGMARVMRAHALQFPRDPGELIDTCGTGGDQAGTFNISTAAAFIGAAAGLQVAKHGNRAATSRSGGADVLEALGARIDLEPEAAAQCLRKVGITFLYARRYHPAMQHVGSIRRELPFPTIFNLLGPLCNPAHPELQVLGVYREDLQELVASAIALLGSPKKALIVHGHGGLDELSLSGPSRLILVEGEELSTCMIEPTELGFKAAPREALAGGSALENAELMRRILANRCPGPCTDVVVLNAAAALWVAGLASNWPAAIEMGQEALRSGNAYDKLVQFVSTTNTGA